jgi:tRNA(Ile)-lysidine synthase
MREVVEETIRRHRMLEPGQTVGLAVSGGADSMALVDVMAGLAAGWRWSLQILHVNHLLRGEESEQDQRFVEAQARRYGIPLRVERRPVPPDRNLEEAARLSRLDFFRRLLRAGEVDRVATGHTRSDQAETVLFRLLRGSGTAGLAGIRPVTSDCIVRPFLDVSRAQVLAYLTERQLPWREDSSNQSEAFARNRIRRRWLPELSAENPSLEETLARTADWAREEEEFWAGYLRTALAHVARDAAGGRILPVAVLTGLPRAAARRLARAAAGQIKGDLRGLTLEHVDRIVAMAERADGHDRMQAPGLDVVRSFSWMRFARPEPPQSRDFCFPLPESGRTPLPGGWVLRVELTESEPAGDCVYNDGVGRLDWFRLRRPLVVRNWRPGDQYQPAGRSAASKIKALFQEFRVPLWERRSWPVVTAGPVVVWSRRFGPEAGCCASPESAKVLKIWEEPVSGRTAPDLPAAGETEVS